MKILYVILIVYTIQICPAQSAYKLVLVPIANKSLVDWHHSHLNSSKIKPKLTLILISNIVITSSLMFVTIGVKEINSLIDNLACLIRVCLHLYKNSTTPRIPKTLIRIYLRTENGIEDVNIDMKKIKHLSNCIIRVYLITSNKT